MPQPRESRAQKVRLCCAGFCSRIRRDLLLVLIVVGVIIGFIIGAAVNEPVNQIADPQQKATVVMLIGFPGELFMNMLKMLILPLIVASLICALASLDATVAGKIGRRTMLYFVMTTLIAVVLGLVLAAAIQPGKGGKPVTDVEEAKPRRNLDSFLDVIRSCFPDNLVEASFRQEKTKYKSVPAKVKELNKTVPVTQTQPNVMTVVYNNGTHNYTTVNQTISPAYDMIPAGREVAASGGMNVLGLVVFSIVFGAVLGRMGDKGATLRAFFEELNEVVMKIVKLVMWYSPVGICSLIAAKLAAMENIFLALRMLGLYMATVIGGIFIHSLIILPLTYFVITRKNPYVFLKGTQEALVTGFGCASSSATLPTTMKCVEENNGVDRRVSRFVLPLGATVNMDGTALYEGASTLWIAQMNGSSLGVGQLITTVLTATAASVGAAGIPSASLVTMIVVLQAVNLPIDDIGLILAVDWFLDRFRTSVNIFGDAYGAGIVQHLSSDDLVVADVIESEEGTPLKASEIPEHQESGSVMILSNV